MLVPKLLPVLVPKLLPMLLPMLVLVLALVLALMPVPTSVPASFRNPRVAIGRPTASLLGPSVTLGRRRTYCPGR